MISNEQRTDPKLRQNNPHAPPSSSKWTGGDGGTGLAGAVNSAGATMGARSMGSMMNSGRRCSVGPGALQMPAIARVLNPIEAGRVVLPQVFHPALRKQWVTAVEVAAALQRFNFA